MGPQPGAHFSVVATLLWAKPDIPGEALLRARGDFAVRESGISGPANKFLDPKNLFALAIVADTGENFREDLHTVGDNLRRLLLLICGTPDIVRALFFRRSVAAGDVALPELSAAAGTQATRVGLCQTHSRVGHA